MPNSINVPTPPMFSGDAENKIRQVHTYLYRLSEQLALILNSIETTGTQIVQSGSAASSSGDIYAIRDQLKQLIVNTTSTLRQEMAEINANLLNAIDASVDLLDGQLRKEIEDQVAGITERIDELETALTESIEAISASVPIVRKGSAMCANALAGGQHEDVVVSFEAMPAVPTVVVSLIGGDDGEHGGSISYRVLTGTITESGFIARVSNSSGHDAAHNYGISWMAVAEGGQDGDDSE